MIILKPRISAHSEPCIDAKMLTRYQRQIADKLMLNQSTVNRTKALTFSKACLLRTSDTYRSNL